MSGDPTELVKQAREAVDRQRPGFFPQFDPRLVAALADAVVELQLEAKRLRAEVGVARGERTAARARAADLEAVVGWYAKEWCQYFDLDDDAEYRCTDDPDLASEERCGPCCARALLDSGEDRP